MYIDQLLKDNFEVGPAIWMLTEREEEILVYLNYPVNNVFC
jgi:hypothetical protein